MSTASRVNKSNIKFVPKRKTVGKAGPASAPTPAPTTTPSLVPPSNPSATAPSHVHPKESTATASNTTVKDGSKETADATRQEHLLPTNEVPRPPALDSEASKSLSRRSQAIALTPSGPPTSKAISISHKRPLDEPEGPRKQTRSQALSRFKPPSDSESETEIDEPPERTTDVAFQAAPWKKAPPPPPEEVRLYQPRRTTYKAVDAGKMTIADLADPRDLFEGRESKRMPAFSAARERKNKLRRIKRRLEKGIKVDVEILREFGLLKEEEAAEGAGDTEGAALVTATDETVNGDHSAVPTEPAEPTEGADAEDTFVENELAPQLISTNAVDESTLVRTSKELAGAENAPTEYVEGSEELPYRRVTSATHGKQKKSDKWTEAETDFFYDCLSQFGSDFELMAELFQNRTRRQIKAKWNREDKLNPRRITAALMRRKDIDFEQYNAKSGRNIDKSEPIPEDPMDRIRIMRDEADRAEEVRMESIMRSEEKRRAIGKIEPMVEEVD